MKQVKCLECQTLTYNKKFCSRSCSAKYNNASSPKRKKFLKRCLNCDSYVNYKGGKYCSFSCSTEHRKLSVISAWLNGTFDGSRPQSLELSRTIRNFLLSEANYRCQSPDCCVPGGWSQINPTTGKVPLEIDHIDGDSTNNSPSNLIVLCPNCHSLTPTFRALNKNSKRTYRVKNK